MLYIYVVFNVYIYGTYIRYHESVCNDCNDLNATLLDASEVSPPQKRSKGKPYEFLKSFSTFDEAFESFGVLPRLREHKWT